jgi:hypothetical protein
MTTQAFVDEGTDLNYFVLGGQLYRAFSFSNNSLIRASIYDKMKEVSEASDDIKTFAFTCSLVQGLFSR